MERCVCYQGGVRRYWKVRQLRKCDSHRTDVKGIREVCQLTERCDGYEEGVRRCWKV